MNVKYVAAQPRISVSVVSHDQGDLVALLLQDLLAISTEIFEVIVTLNVPENEEFIDSAKGLDVVVIRNLSPKGFGANHNQASRLARGEYFCVVNPDIRCPDLELQPLIDLVSSPRVGVCAPVVVSPDGIVEDSARLKPKLGAMIKRFIIRSNSRDYDIAEETVQVDWVAGMFMMFNIKVFEEVAGFDERFYMYLEDADICDRIRAQGLSILVHPKSIVIHAARRYSRKKIRFLFIHISSAIKYFLK